MKLFYVALSLVLIVLTPQCGFAQFHDNHWLLGYEGGAISEPDDSFGISILTFYDAELSIENDQELIDLDFDAAGISFSDYSGNLLVYTNGFEVRNADDIQLINGNLGGSFGDPESILTQSLLFLPHSQDMEDMSLLRMLYTEDLPRLGAMVNHARIDPYLNDIGLLYDQSNAVVFDSLSTGELTACRHANGRDWWVLKPKADKSLIYSILITPYDIQVVDTITTNYSLSNGLGQSTFSPDGTKYFRLNLVTFGEEGQLDIFDFNRCTGELTNHIQGEVGIGAWSGGLAVSPSSEYLYVSHYDHVFQYDLTAADIFTTKDTVATYDGYTEWNFFHSRFFQAQLAPDGKIYLNNSSGVKTLHVINEPDRAGIACDLAQHAIPLPNYNSFTLANHPNYRLGPIDGSTCDTLGIDNFPKAYYRIDRNPEDTLDFHFQDLSFYEPDTWAWTFGDGGMSTDRHPDHTYASPGIYEVCLTVSNNLGSDTDCRILELGPVAVDDPQALIFSTFPNPVQDVLVFDLGDYYPLNGQFKLYNAAGQLVFSQQVLYSQARMQLAPLPAGIYFYEFWDGGVKLGQGKVVKG